MVRGADEHEATVVVSDRLQPTHILHLFDGVEGPEQRATADRVHSPHFDAAIVAGAGEASAVDELERVDELAVAAKSVDVASAARTPQFDRVVARSACLHTHTHTHSLWFNF